MITVTESNNHVLMLCYNKNKLENCSTQVTPDFIKCSIEPGIYTSENVFMNAFCKLLNETKVIRRTTDKKINDSENSYTFKYNISDNYINIYLEQGRLAFLYTPEGIHNLEFFANCLFYSDKYVVYGSVKKNCRNIPAVNSLQFAKSNFMSFMCNVPHGLNIGYGTRIIYRKIGDDKIKITGDLSNRSILFDDIATTFPQIKDNITVDTFDYNGNTVKLLTFFGFEELYFIKETADFCGIKPENVKSADYFVNKVSDEDTTRINDIINIHGNLISVPLKDYKVSIPFMRLSNNQFANYTPVNVGGVYYSTDIISDADPLVRISKSNLNLVFNYQTISVYSSMSLMNLLMNLINCNNYNLDFSLAPEINGVVSSKYIGRIELINGSTFIYTLTKTDTAIIVHINIPEICGNNYCFSIGGTCTETSCEAFENKRGNKSKLFVLLASILIVSFFHKKK